MEGQFEIRPITAAAMVDLRWTVLRPGFPRESAIFAGDDAIGTLHFGAFMDKSLVGVASLFDSPMPNAPSSHVPKQLRGMATLPEVRGSGAGRALLAACVRSAMETGCDLLWCNARAGAVAFYRKHGWKTCSEEFDIPTVGPHFQMWRPLSDHSGAGQRAV